MKKILLVLLALLLAVIACGGDGTPTTYVSFDERCSSNWDQLNVETGFEQETVTMLLNNEWPPDSVGFAVAKCIDAGWTGWR